MARRKTNAEFVAEVKALVGDEYTFSEEYVNSYTKIVVIHNECGHEYKVTPDCFLKGTRCPKCVNESRTKSDSEFKQEVREMVGNEYSFLEEYKNARTKIKVVHIECGHEYSVKPNDFLLGRRCPKCYGSMKKTDYEFKKEAFNLFGNEYEFLENYINYSTKIKVMHRKCGHKYRVSPANFLKGKRCPNCFKSFADRRKTDSEFQREVFELVGDEYKFKEEYKGAGAKIKIKHNKCGYEYEIAPATFLNTGSRCPRCLFSRGEKAVEEFLLSNKIKFISEYPIKITGRKRPLRADFFAEGVVIEYDGEQHFKAREAWGGERALRETQRRDRIKDEYCAANGIPMIRIPYWDFDRIDEILTDKLLPIIRKKDDKLA